MPAGSSSMIPELLFPVVGALLALLGWPLAARRIGPNRWYGLRVPATFADRRVWFDAIFIKLVRRDPGEEPET